MAESLRWIESHPITVPKEFRKAIGGHPLVAETLYRRGYRTVEVAEAFMNPDHYKPASADELPDAEIAYKLLTEAINNHEKILVWGDFDVDGQTATTILVEALQNLGADVRYHIPIRAKESHGIKAEALESFMEAGFDLLITCDTGITEHENIQTVMDADIPVIVTDHHSLSARLPPADAVVNPQRLPESHPLRTLPGVGVTCKLMEGLYDYVGADFDSGAYYELAALGIVADVAIQRADTRWMLQKGLAHLRHTDRIGLQALFKTAGLNPANLDETHIGFQIAPRLNAVGRLDDANPIVELLTTSNPGRARVLASKIEALNAKRRFATQQVEKAAERLLHDSADDRRASAIVLHYPDWPGGVVGIVAARLVERYHKPTILLTGNDPVHGSARSVEGINITQAIGSQADLLTGYGGHPMAAGMSLPADDFPAFKQGVLAFIEARASEVEITPEIIIHHQLSLSDINLELISEIKRLAPFGPGNPPLNFLIPDLHLESSREVGQTGEHRQVTAREDSGEQQRFIWWKCANEVLPDAPFDLICHLSENDYQGTPQVSAEWIAFRYSERGQVERASRSIESIDLRLSPHRVTQLNKILEDDPTAQIWAEVTELPIADRGQPRQKLSKAHTLVVWTVPPSPAVLMDVIRHVSPEKIIFIGENPNLANATPFLNRLAGLVKFATQQKSGQTTLTDLAAACAAERETVRIGLKLWEAKGAFQAKIEDDNVEIFLKGEESNPDSINIYNEVLQNLLVETDAYRRYFSQANLERLIPEIGSKN
ncbi:single-stranded-DNA-specific exonuclease RecJ [bacterium]|nr:single-stranded-DNA-specific exonuclease RecJ [bacterium]